MSELNDEWEKITYRRDRKYEGESTTGHTAWTITEDTGNGSDIVPMENHPTLDEYPLEERREQLRVKTAEIGDDVDLIRWQIEYGIIQNGEKQHILPAHTDYYEWDENTPENLDQLLIMNYRAIEALSGENVTLRILQTRIEGIDFE